MITDIIFMNTMFILGGIGVTLIITESKLFRWARECVNWVSDYFGDFISCPQCVGTWIGCCVYFVLPAEFRIETVHILLDLFLYGGVTSLLSLISARFIFGEVS